MEIEKFPDSVLVQIFKFLDTQSKLTLANGCKRYYELIFKSQIHKVWNDVQVSVSTGVRTLPLLQKVAPYVFTVKLDLVNSALVASLPDFPVAQSVKLFRNYRLSVPTLVELYSKFPHGLQSLDCPGKFADDRINDVANLPNFPTVQSLTFVGTYNISVTEVVNLYTKFPALKTIECTGRIEDNSIFTLPRMVPNLRRFTLHGCWMIIDWTVTPEIVEDTLRNGGMDRLEVCVVKKLDLRGFKGNGSQLEAMLEALSNSPIAEGVCEIQLSWSWFDIPAKAYQLQNFTSLHTIKIREGDVSILDAIPWQIIGLRTVFVSLSDDLLSDDVGCIAQHTESLQNLVLECKGMIPFDAASAVVLLLPHDSPIEYFYLKSHCDRATDQLYQIYRYLLQIAPSLGNLKFLHIELTFPEHDPNVHNLVEEFNLTDLVDSLPLQNVIVKFNDVVFTDAEKDAIMSFQGWKQTKMPVFE